MVVGNPTIRSVTKCQICILKEQGVPNAEDYVLSQYYIPNDTTRVPIPVDADLSMEGGILLLNPDTEEGNKNAPMSGGFFGTVRSLFKVFGFNQEQEEIPISKDVAKRKRTGGLYDERVK
jgi:hypothetical protein